MMAREGWHRHRDRHDEKQRQKLFHAPDYSDDLLAVNFA
jgi:hypothetical protein